MRKRYWLCAIGLVALGLIHAASEYTFRHPDTALGRSVVGAYQISMHFGPLYHAGTHLFAHASSASSDSFAEDELSEIPDEPEPVALAEAEPSTENAELQPADVVSDPNRGRLPGKIIIDEGEEPPMAGYKDRLSPEPNLERIVERMEIQWHKDDEAAGLKCDPLVPVQGTADATMRQMPMCEDDEPQTRAMPFAEQQEETVIRRAIFKVWNPFPPRGTEVGGEEESELNSPGNNLRENPSGSLEHPGCPAGTACPKKEAPTGEEPSEFVPERKSKNSKKTESRKFLEDPKILPSAGRPQVDTMEFRPSDWGKDDVPLPPF
jgi:hypothetical protein